MFLKRLIAVEKKKELQYLMKYKDCFAKTFVDKNGNKKLGYEVLEHCKIVGKIANKIVQQIPNKIRRKIFPKESGFIASLHDIGKVCPTFQKKIFEAVNDKRKDEFGGLPDESGWGGHATISQITMEDFGFDSDDYIPDILGRHHGYCQTYSITASPKAEFFGGELWQKERIKLVNALEEYFKCSLSIINSIINSFEQAQAIAGLTSVADWIGSGKFFENPQDNWHKNIDISLENAGFVVPKIIPNLSFKDIFGFNARETQIKLIENVNSSGVYVLEAPMGLGKTEAALYVAYKMLSSQNNRGIYFALPTQLTSNKIYNRFNKFLEKILAEDSLHKHSLLLHGNAWLVNSEMGEEGDIGNSWYSSLKRGILAPFAVGTIDQALMACINVKHSFIRTFGLAGKVVILDEVHSYDTYTGTIMDNLISMLRKLGCTVIILSATLTKSRTKQLLKLEKDLKNDSYPLITAINEKENINEIGLKLKTNNEVNISIVNNENIAIKEALNALYSGQQVLFIQNTVKEAQETYQNIKARINREDIECNLLHSRFTAKDRQAKEDKYVNLFGKDGWNERNKKGRILIGTQVLEQSLDIDADLLITKFCPTDMLLQRLGRLWRHKETPRNKTATCKAIIITPKLEETIENEGKQFGKTFYVYNPYILCRSLEVWQNIKKVSLPNDIRNLIEETYRERDENGNMKDMLKDLQEKRNTLKRFALNAQSKSSKGKPDTAVWTRYNEIDYYNVLLVRKFIGKKDCTEITLLDGDILTIPLKNYILNKEERKKIAIKLMQNIVKVSEKDVPYNEYKFLKERGLGNFIYLGDKKYGEKNLFRIAIVDDSGELKSIDGNNIHKNRLFYNKQIGYLRDER